jgi:uncharacterized protein (TIGR03083 family)
MALRGFHREVMDPPTMALMTCHHGRCHVLLVDRAEPCRRASSDLCRGCLRSATSRAPKREGFVVGKVRVAYAGCRARIAELTGRLDGQRAATAVPTCPKWSVHDVVAHVTGVVDDALAGRLDGMATEPWTAAQVEARRARPIADMLAEWDANAPSFEELLDTVGDPGRQAVTDVVTHEHDIRAALDEPGARDSDAVHIGLGFVSAGFVASAAGHGVAVRVHATDGSEFGDQAASVVLSGDPFELLRAMTGRRSIPQLRAMHWQGDGEAALGAFTFGPFRPAAHRVVE